MIDDDKSIHAFVKAALTAHPINVISAFDPTQAITFVRKDKPDLILLDIKMPAGGGTELFKRLQTLPQTSSIPIIILSALTKVAVEGQLADVKNLEILTKPITKDDLANRVSTLLSKS